MPDLAAVVLCEDLQSRTVLYRFLKERGYPVRRIWIRPYPAGAGCGSQHVRERYPTEVKVQRRAHVGQVLVVHIDADNHTVHHRHQELAQALAGAGEAPRQANEPIALVVPKWEMETWIGHFLGQTVAEGQKASKYTHQGDAAQPLVDALLALVQGRGSPPSHLPALTQSVDELRRLP